MWLPTLHGRGAATKATASARVANHQYRVSAPATKRTTSAPWCADDRPVHCGPNPTARFNSATCCWLLTLPTCSSHPPRTQKQPVSFPKWWSCSERRSGWWPATSRAATWATARPTTGRCSSACRSPLSTPTSAIWSGTPTSRTRLW